MAREASFKLPISIVSDADINRLLRELGSLEDFLLSVVARKSDISAQPPRLTRMLNQLATDNSCNLLEEKDRTRLKDGLKNVQVAAPQLHISFATEASPKVLEEILVWLRTNIHPIVLLQVGLQPTIAAGCVLRTPNKVFDMSLRVRLDSQRDYLLALVRGAANG